MAKTKSQIRLVGKVKEPHGLRGDLYILVFSGDISWAKKLKTFVLKKSETDTQQTEYEITAQKPHKDGLIVHAKGIDNRNLSEPLKGQLFFIDAKHLITKDKDEFYLSEIQDFQVLHQGSEIGYVRSFSSNGEQDILVVENDTHKYEIPLVQEFIRDLNFDTQKIDMILPEGLLEITGVKK